MISTEILKDIIASNENFIMKTVHSILERRSVQLPTSLNKVIIFYGLRRSGKTFILYNIFRNNPDTSLYIDFEDERLGNFQLNDFERLKNVFFELKPQLIGKKIIFLFDEIQNVDGWEKYCRRVVEKEGHQVLVTGSSSRMMPLEIHTELRGRSWSVEVMPFSFNEYLIYNNIDPLNKKWKYGNNKIHLQKYFLKYLKWGGFPEVIIAKEEFEKNKLLTEYLSALFFRDLVERFKITNIQLLEHLIDKLLSSFSLKISLSAFYNQYKTQFQFSKDLLYRYYHYFIQSMLLFEVTIFSESSYKRNRNPKKIYLTDIGLCKKVTSEDRGRVLENIVFLELHRKDLTIHYFQGDKECDFITTDSKKKRNVIQVCWDINDENKDREIGGLKEAAQFCGIKKGFIITKDIEDEFDSDGIHVQVIPGWKWVLEGEGGL